MDVRLYEKYNVMFVKYFFSIGLATAIVTYHQGYEYITKHFVCNVFVHWYRVLEWIQAINAVDQSNLGPSLILSY